MIISRIGKSLKRNRIRVQAGTKGSFLSIVAENTWGFKGYKAFNVPKSRF